MSQQVLADPFAVLGVTDSSTDEEIEKAWKAKMRKAHPDVGGSEEEAKQLNWARDTLLDPWRRFDFVMAKVQERYGPYVRTATAREEPGQPKAKPASEAPPRREKPAWEPPRQQAPKYTWQPPAQPIPKQNRKLAHWIPAFGVLAALSYVPLMTLLTWPTAGRFEAYEQGSLALATIGWVLALLAWSDAGKSNGKSGVAAAFWASVGAMILLAVASVALFVGGEVSTARPAYSASADPGTAPAHVKGAAIPGEAVAEGGCKAERVKGERTAPDPDCSPGVILREANRASVCQGSLSTVRPEKMSRWAAKEAVTRSYSRNGRSVGEYSFVVPPKLGGAWHLQNLWVGASTATPETVKKTLRLLCSSGSPVSYDQVIKAAKTNSLDKLVRRYA
jgi:hypothetical protein